MSLLDWQGSYNGLVMGGSDPSVTVEIIDVQGWESLPDVASGDTQRPRSRGLLSGLDFAGGRSVTLSLNIAPAAGLNLPETVELVKAAFLIQQSDELPLQLSLPGVKSKISYCRPRKRDIKLDVAYEKGSTTATVLLVAADPCLYDATLSSQTVTLPTPASGVTFPATFPLTFGGTTGGGGVVAALNAGTVETYGVATITGPCISPRVENNDTGVSLALDLTLGPTDTVEIDFAAHTVILNGSGYRYDTVVAPNWWALPANTTTHVGFYSSDPSPTGAAMTFEWRSAWM